MFQVKSIFSNYFSTKIPDTDWLVYKFFGLLFLDFFAITNFFFEVVWHYFVSFHLMFVFLVFVCVSSLFFLASCFFSLSAKFFQNIHSFIFIFLFAFLSLFPIAFFENVLAYYSFTYFDFFIYDEFSYALILLTSFLYGLIFKYYNVVNSFSFSFLSLLVFSFYILMFTFSVSRLFHFYIFFEAILIPFFFLISIWGSNVRRIWAAERLLFFTLFLSVPFFYFITRSFFFDQTFLTFNFFFNYLYFTNNFADNNFFCLHACCSWVLKFLCFPFIFGSLKLMVKRRLLDR